jgi:outer membrane protein TolC
MATAIAIGGSLAATAHAQPPRLAPPVGAVHPAQNSPARPIQNFASTRAETIPTPKLEEQPGFLIDLPTVWRLADANNLQVAYAREQVNLALARVDAAGVLWLPSVRGGANYNRHEGAIQRIEGMQINTSRGAYYGGLGAGGYGGGSPPIPGLYANFALADALFQPLAARQFAAARTQAASAVTNDTLLQVTLGYLELLRAAEDVAIAHAVRADAQLLVNLTSAYADAGAGLRSDANRARAELAVRLNDVQRAQEAHRVASARLAQLLRLDPTVVLEPLGPCIVPIDIVPPTCHTKELIAQGLSQRPELAEHRLLVGEAVDRLRRERSAVVLPSIILGGSYGGMGSGINEQLAPFTNRLDFDAIAYWEMRNLGFGEAAARRAAQSTVRGAQYRQLAVMDQVAREVVEAHVQVQSRVGQMAIARNGLEAAVASQQQNFDRIQQAKGLPIEVLQAIQALAQARKEYLRSVIDYDTAQFTLYRGLCTITTP